RSLAEVAPETPRALVQIVGRCLRKRASERYTSAEAVGQDLEQLLPTRRGRRLGAEDCPYPGLLPFEEGDADRFFGRSREVARAPSVLRDQPVLAIVGPSGAGKSSFIRAGVIPELRDSGHAWEVFVIRPGREPLAGFVPIVEACAGAGDPAERKAWLRAA